MNPRYWSCRILLGVLCLSVLTRGESTEVATTAIQRADPTLLQFVSAGHVLGFAQDSVYVAGGTHALRVEFVNAYLTAPFSAARTGETTRAAPLIEVSYPNLWPGVTLTYDAPPVGILRSTYRIEPNADVSQIRLRYNAPVTIEPDGGLAIGYAVGVLRESAPRAWQELSNGGRVPVEAVFTRLSERQVGIKAGPYDHSRPLFIDPTLTWNTFLGGISVDQGYGIAVDGSGNVYVAGVSQAAWGSPIRGYSGGYSDAFAARLDGSGNLAWNTFLGGSGQDVGHAIAVDGCGNVYIAGYSDATWGAPVRAYLGDYDAFAARLDSSGNLTWNTFLGGNDKYKLNKGDTGHAIAVDGNGNVYVTGKSWNTWGSPIRAYTPDSRDAFAAKLDGSGSLAWNTFLGSGGDDFGNGIAVDGSGNSYVAGEGCGSWGSPVNPYAGWCDGFVAKLDGSGSLAWNTFLGSSGQGDAADAVAVDGSGNVYVVGFSEITWGSPVHAYADEDDAFAARLDNSGNLTWHTFLGGSENDYGYEIAADGSGNAFVVGYSRATWGSPVHPFTTAPDAFAAGLDSSGNLTWNTFLGGGNSDYGYAITADCRGNVYVAGTSYSNWGFPIRSHTGSGDAFVVKLSVELPRRLYLPLIFR
jgi:hypothetical protein